MFLFCYRSSCFALSCVMMAVSAYDPDGEFKHNNANVLHVNKSASNVTQQICRAQILLYVPITTI